MSRTRTGVRQGSQSPADCKVYGQETRVFLLRPLMLQALGVAIIACALIVAVMVVSS